MTDLTLAYITALTGSPDTVMDWRIIHDQTRQAQNLRGSYQQLAQTLHAYNQQGYGIFCNINALDGQGHTLSNVDHIRTHVVDLDDPATAGMSYAQAVGGRPQPHFAVQTSPDKYHIYWLVEPYCGNDFYTAHQRKLAQLYQGDPSIVDATRVLRVPGFYHCKGEPFLVTCWSVGNNPRYTAQQIEQYLSHINIVEHSTTRQPLGTPELAAPSLEWLRYALDFTDPNQMTYEEWMAFTAAFKQAGWSLTDEQTLYDIWSKWCERYTANDTGENLKLWKSHKDTQVGWSYILNKAPHVRGEMVFGPKETPQAGSLIPQAGSLSKRSIELNKGQEILGEHEMPIWFEGCYLISREGRIFTPQGRYMNSGQFNAEYGGKYFMINNNGKITNEAWQAATRSTVWTLPKVDHVRFLPGVDPMTVVLDELKRPGLNTYIPTEVEMYEGDISIWLNHIAKLLPDQNDQRLWHEYFAHCIKYPGHKIQYAPMMQSVEGVGKSAFYEIMAHALGSMYTYRPKAPELVSSGSKFNAWMRGKLMIMVDEIKVDERRELIEILKPMITDNRIEIQSKGVDQDMEDNMANWLFFSNYKDAIPINKNGRRYAIFYTAMQSERDILNAGMDKAYFDQFWSWLRAGGGLQMITWWYKHYPLDLGAIPVRAPKTSSYEEAIRISRSPLEIILQDAVEDDLTGFKNNFISVQAAMLKARNMGVRNVTTRTVQTVLEQMGYFEIGKTPSPIPQEDVSNRSIIYSRNAMETVENYMRSQGYAL